MGVLVWSWRCSLQSDSWTAAVDNDMLRSWCLVFRPALHCQWNGRCGFMMRVNSVPLQHSSRPASCHKHGLHRHRNCWGCFQPFSIRGAGVRRVWRLSFIWQTDVTSVSEKHYSQHKNNRFNLLVSPSLQSHTEPQRESDSFTTTASERGLRPGGPARRWRSSVEFTEEEKKKFNKRKCFKKLWNSIKITFFFFSPIPTGNSVRCLKGPFVLPCGEKMIFFDWTHLVTVSSSRRRRFILCCRRKEITRRLSLAVLRWSLLYVIPHNSLCAGHTVVPAVIVLGTK